MNELLSLSALRLAELIRSKKASSLEIVDAHISHAQKVNPLLNAIVSDRFDDARKEARNADLLLASANPSELPALHGVPCTIKEAFAFNGMPNTSGLLSRIGKTASADATCVKRLRSAGAIALGVTNVSELCMWMESNNLVYGRTHNPYDPRRTAGGSSGGEGSIIGAGASPFGLGSDVGGSIRMPAFFNGVFGHKPTGGRIPNSGQHPTAHGDGLYYLTTGPLCRRAEDLWPLVQILSGPDGIDTACTTEYAGHPNQVDLKSLRVLSIASNGVTHVSAQLRRSQRDAIDALKWRGLEVQERSFKKLAQSLEIWGSRLAEAGGTSFSEFMGGGRPISGMTELMRWAFGSARHTFPAIGLALTEKIPPMFPGRTKRFSELGRLLEQELIEAIGPHGVMLYPSYATVAPFHNAPFLSPFDWVYTAIFNALKFPSTQVPLGLNDTGLPLGIQVVSAPGNDHLTIAVALELERAFGGWVMPRVVAS